MAASLVLAASVAAGAAWYYGSFVSRCITSPEFAELEAAIEAQKQLGAARQRAEADKSPAVQEALRAAEQKYDEAKRRVQARKQNATAARPADACKG